MIRRAILALAAAALAAPAAEVEKGVAASNIKTFSFLSESLGERRNVNILLPPDYDNSTRRYPTLYLLHGYGDDHTAWSYMTNLSHYAAQHRVIVVMPDGSKSFYVNSAVDPKAKFEDYIVKDLIGYVDSNYRSIPLPRARAVAGLSMGGYGAAFLGLKHADTYAAIGAFSGALGISHEMPNTPANADAARRTRQMQAVFGAPASADRTARDPFVLLAKVPAGQMPMIYVACGGQDFLLSQNRAFVELLAQKNIPYEYREVSPRVHSWDFWDDQIRIFLGMIARLPGFRQN